MELRFSLCGLAPQGTFIATSRIPTFELSEEVIYPPGAAVEAGAAALRRKGLVNELTVHPPNVTTLQEGVGFYRPEL